MAVDTNPDRERNATLVRVALVLVALVGATLAAAILEQGVGLADASPVYLIAVVLAAATLGTSAAVVTSLAAFISYDYLFTTPRFTFQVSDPAEWLSLLLFLLVAFVIGRLTSLMRERAEMADRRVREGMALVAISREIAMAISFTDAAASVAERLRVDAEMGAVWISLAGDEPSVVVIAGAAPSDASGLPVATRIHEPVDPATLDELLERVPEFRLAYERAGLAPDELETYGASRRTMRQFLAAYQDLQAEVRDAVLPNPDRKLVPA